jgi:hypothetical protein
MEFYPKNKYLLVEPVEDAKPENKTSGFILPEDYKKQETHKVVRILRASPGSQYVDLCNSLAVVPVNMIETITVLDRTLTVIPETAVYGVFHR